MESQAGISASQASRQRAPQWIPRSCLSGHALAFGDLTDPFRSEGAFCVNVHNLEALFCALHRMLMKIGTLDLLLSLWGRHLAVCTTHIWRQLCHHRERVADLCLSTPASHQIRMAVPSTSQFRHVSLCSACMLRCAPEIHFGKAWPELAKELSDRAAFHPTPQPVGSFEVDNGGKVF